MTRDEKLKLCASCRENYYNQPGHSTTGECWMLADAKPVQRTAVGIWQNPPYHWKPQTTLNCHHWDGGLTWIREDDCRIVRAENQKEEADEAESKA